MRAERVKMDSRIISVHVDEDSKKIRMSLADGRDIAAPYEWFSRLRKATPKQRGNVKVLPGGYSVRWPDVDEDIHISAFLAQEEIVVFPERDFLLRDDGSLLDA